MSFGFGFGFPRRLTSGGGLSPSLYLDFVGTNNLPSTVTFSRGTNATLTDSNGRIAWAPHNLLTNSEDFEAAGWTVTGTTVSANQTLAPDGTTTADKLLETATTANHGIFRSATTVAGSAYTLSWYFKAAERGFARAGYTDGGIDYAVRVNLSTGAITLTDAGITGSVSDAGNGWWRLAVTRTVANASVNVFAGINQDATGTSAYAGNTSSGIFIWGAQLNVANAPVNLLTWSQDFDNAAWTKLGVLPITQNSVSAPDGTLTADTLTADSTASSQHNIQQGPLSFPAGTYTFSASLKYNNNRWLGVAIYDTTWRVAAFDIQNGVVGTAIAPGVTASITNQGNGWYRCQVTYTTATASLYGGVFLLPSDTTSRLWTTTGVEAVYVWGAQLNTGSVALPYVATTSSIYLPPAYNSTTPKNLLGFTQEPENAAWTKSNSYVQQNLLTWSQDFDNAAWTKAAQISVDANVAVDPTGTTTADKVRANAPLLSTSAIYTTLTTAAVSYTYSIYAKADGANFVYLFWDNGATEHGRYFDLVNGTAGNTVGAAVTASSITAVGSGWYRCSITFTGIAATTYPAFLPSTTNATGRASQAGTTPNGILTWGAQLVQGSTAGDYTQTTSAAAPTRYLNWDGTLTGRKLVETTAASVEHRIFQTVVLPTVPCVLSFYAKAAERNWVWLYANAGLQTAFVDISTGTIGTTFGSPTMSAVAVGGGWYRVSMVFNNTTLTSQNLQIWIATSNGTNTYTGDGTSGIYVSDFQLSNSASVDPYVYNPQAAAASAAFYGPRFDYNPTGTPVLSGTEMMPASPTWAYVGTGVSAVGQTVTFSAASAGAQAYANLGLTVGQFYSITFTISNYTSGSFYIDLGGGSLGTGVRNANGTYTAIVYVTPNPSMYVVSSGAGGTAQVTISRVQAVTGYTATANGLLIEEQRTNLLTYSEQFDNAAWTKDLNRGSFVTNAVSPTGATTAQTLTAGTGGFGYAFRTIFSLTVSTAYTFSFYAKAGTSNFAYFEMCGSALSYVNLTTLATAPAAGVTVTATPVGSGWVRITGVATASATSHIFSLGGADASGSQAMASGNTVILWGAQLEAGSFATSYIPTVASQVTRNADSASMLGDNFYTWYNVNQGSWSSEFATTNTGNAWVFAVTTSAGQHDLVKGPTTVNYRYGNGVNSDNPLTITLGSAIGKFAGAYTLNGTHAAAINGSAVTTTGVSAAPTETGSLRLGTASGGTTPLNGTIRRIGYYNTRLPDSTLQALTV